MTEDRARKLQKRSELLSDTKNDAVGLYMVHAAEYYRWLMAPAAQSPPLPSVVLTQHRCLGSTLGGEPSGNREFPHLPHAAWELKVTYGRR